jgi:hypothetical protein
MQVYALAQMYAVAVLPVDTLCNIARMPKRNKSNFILTDYAVSREVKDPSGAVRKRSHAAHPKVPGIIPGATWHTVTYCDTWQCYKNVYIFSFKISNRV